jgi:predicted membrane protein
MARVLSFLLAAVLALGLLLLPALRGRGMTPAGHGLLMPLLLAICAGFIQGVGYVPDGRVPRAPLQPALLWPTMLGLGLAWTWYS